jgi:hypothetical protein
MVRDLRQGPRARRARARRALLAAAAALVLAGIGQPLPATAAASAGDAADRLTFWAKCENVVSLSDTELDAWRERGVDGFTCMVGRLRGMGGSQDFTGDPDASLGGANYDLQRRIRDSGIVERAAARGIKLYLGAYLVNHFNHSTPLRDWFDDGGWSQVVLPRMRDLAAAARLLGFAGLAFDQELYPQQGGVDTATWAWSYPGNTHTEPQVRARAEQRGEELMGAIVDAFPGAELAVHHAFFPDDWRERVHELLGGTTRTSAARVDIDLWAGMTSVEGYGAIRFFDSIFFKGPHFGTWENAFTYNQNRVLAALSQRFSNWDYAASRVHLSPLSWINPGPDPGSFDDARSPTYVQNQLLAFRRWGMGGEFGNFVYGSLRNFDYSPYANAMQAASSPGNADGLDPTLDVASTASAPEPPPTFAGTAHDNLAIRAVRWSDDQGRSGVAELTWSVLAGDYSSGYDWEMRWSFPAADLTPGATRVTITAEDIKDRSSAPAVIAWAPEPDPPPAPPPAPEPDPPPPNATIAGEPPPGTGIGMTITAKPPKRLSVMRREAEVRFRFSSTAGGTRPFLCRLDAGEWRECSSGFATYEIRARHRWRRHAFEAVVVTGDEGVVPARYRFKVRRR